MFFFSDNSNHGESIASPFFATVEAGTCFTWLGALACEVATLTAAVCITVRFVMYATYIHVCIGIMLSTVDLLATGIAISSRIAEVIAKPPVVCTTTIPVSSGFTLELEVVG